MFATSLYEYPEILTAMVLAVALAISTMKGRIPDWFVQPAMSFLSLAPQKYLMWVERALVQAGFRSQMSLGVFAALQLYVPCISLLLLLVLPPAKAGAVIVVLLVLPSLVLKSRVRARQEALRYSLPQALDLMVMCVDAGLALDAALQRLANDDSALSSDLHDEFKVVAREILLGMDRERVYNELYDRTGLDELRTLASALNQANKLGLSIAQILRAQSEFIRRKLAQKAEEKALKIPVYMAFPLWLFIMPALLLVVLGPSLLNFYHQVAARGGL
ncbi:MAG TPA: type II secretion system F family protein [Candidatus Obscuribacterales bacterium]